MSTHVTQKISMQTSPFTVIQPQNVFHGLTPLQLWKAMFTEDSHTVVTRFLHEGPRDIPQMVSIQLQKFLDNFDQGFFTLNELITLRAGLTQLFKTHINFE